MFHLFRRISIQKCDFSRVELTLLHGCSPVNWLNVEHPEVFIEKHLWVTASVYGSEYSRWKRIQQMQAGIQLFRVDIEKLKQGVK